MIKRYKLIHLLILLMVLNSVIVFFMTQHRFQYIVLHHSASWTANYDIIRKQHRGRGWRDAAYHLILSNGSTQVPLGHLEATSRYRFLSYSLATRSSKCNLLGVHLSVVGNYHEKPMPDGVKACLGYALRSLQRKYDISVENILFHRDCSSTACPGQFVNKNDVADWVGALAGQCPENVQKQQDEVIDQARYSIWTFPKTILLAVFGVSVFIGVLWLVVMRRRNGVVDVSGSE